MRREITRAYTRAYTLAHDPNVMMDGWDGVPYPYLHRHRVLR